VTGYVTRVPRLRQPLRPALGSLDVELTERCDNACVHCCIARPQDDEAARVREMTTEQVEDVLRQAVDLGCLRVRFTGGEPLLREDFAHLYLYARRLGLRVLLFTNARRVTPELVDLLQRVPPLVKAEVTVYGMRRESYEAVSRVPGSFDEAWRGVGLLLDGGVPFVAKSALLPPNRDEMDEFEAWCRDVVGMREAPRYAMFLDARARRDDEAADRLIRALRVSPEDGLAVLTARPDEFRREMQDFGGRFMGPQGEGVFDCGAGHGVSVDAYGRAQPCMGVRAPELTVPLFEGAGWPGEWAGAAGLGGGPAPLAAALERFAGLKDVRAQDPEYLRRCARCFLKGLCEQCPAKSWSEHGTLDTPVEYLCAVAHAQARWLGWLGEDEHGWDVEDWRPRVSGAR
jgi:MoaA/NifB/PqqE/SkfB family radical SAM enzyme